MRILTVGFTRKSAQRFFELLHEAGVSRIVDVRLNNASQLAGFAKKNDLEWFARELFGIDYIHEPSLAPTQELLSGYRKKQISWIDYESRFLELMRSRQIESRLPKDILDNGCLLCSEDQPTPLSSQACCRISERTLGRCGSQTPRSQKERGREFIWHLQSRTYV